MMTADQYGNAGDYVFNNVNTATAYMLGQANVAVLGRNKVCVYSIFREDGGAPATQAHRRASDGLAIIGWQGPRPVAFPLNGNWTFDLPLT